MTSNSTQTQSVRSAEVGTFVAMSWSRETPQGAIPYVLAFSLGDGDNGPEGSAAAVEQLMRNCQLSTEEGLVDGSSRPSLPISLLVVDGSVVLTMPQINAQIVPSNKWLADVAERGYACLLLTTRTWPGGELTDNDALAAFANDEETLKLSAKVVLPARKLRDR
ncbi:DUF5949 family protein [Streptomyces sp. NPDC053367]|uniref:DUF5949 family protein n=1 Tax=Streptomyces sp. NPDC053367 TaxID=3365700 RepID=UPI0037D3A9B9